MAGSVTGYMMRIGALIPGYSITTVAAFEDAGIYGVCRSAVFARKTGKVLPGDISCRGVE